MKEEENRWSWTIHAVQLDVPTPSPLYSFYMFFPSVSINKNTALNNKNTLSNISSLNLDCALLDPCTILSSCRATLDLYWAALIQRELKDGPTLPSSGEVGTVEQIPTVFTLVSPATPLSSSLPLLNAEEIPKQRAPAMSLPLYKEADVNLESYFCFKNWSHPSPEIGTMASSNRTE